MFQKTINFTLKTSLFLVFFISITTCFSQKRIPEKLFIDGRVSGFYQNTSNVITKKDRQIKLEGALEGVSINVFQEGKTVYSIKTNKKGVFKLALKVGTLYQMELSKLGYLTSNLLVDLESIPEEVAKKGLVFENLELLLNSYDSDNKIHSTLPFGRLFYNADNNSLNFKEINAKIRKGLFTKEKIENPAVSLIMQSILKNKDVFTEQIYDEKTSEGKSGNTTFPKQTLSSTFVLTNLNIEKFTVGEIKNRESELLFAREQIEKDKLSVLTIQDSILITQREMMLMSAENELTIAKKYIDIQNTVISKQKWVLVLLIGFLLLLLGLLFVIVKNHRQKKAANIILEKRNKKITDSINYAQKIQQSILISIEDVKKIVPESFIFYQPMDIISGDFYWFSEIDYKIIIAAVDCTGHGVPGACMSFIGHSLMNEIINEKKITRPSEILNKLHEGIVTLLHQSDGDMYSQDGMELSLCVFDKKSKILEYSGAMNPIYLIKNKELITLTPNERAIGGISIFENSNENDPFTDKQIQISKNDVLYLFSDGFANQFGGNENIKYNIPRFKNLLLEIHEKELGEQKLLIEDSINNWKDKHKQIDDMLVMGIRF